MHKKFEINWTKIKGGCQSGRKVVTHNSKSYLTPVYIEIKSGQNKYLIKHFIADPILIIDTLILEANHS